MTQTVLYYLMSSKKVWVSDMLRFLFWVIFDTWNPRLLHSCIQVVNIVYTVRPSPNTISLRYIHVPVYRTPFRDMGGELKRHLDFDETYYQKKNITLRLKNWNVEHMESLKLYTPIAKYLISNYYN